jgi:hypothetical protein
MKKILLFEPLPTMLLKRNSTGILNVRYNTAKKSTLPKETCGLVVLLTGRSWV